MVRRKDKLWKHGVELKGRFKCNFCERDFSGGIARLKSHLSGIKGRDIDICTKVPDDVKEAAYLAIHGSNKKAKIDSNVVRNDSNVDNPSLPKILEQSDIMNTCKKNDKNSIDRLLCQLLILNNIPFNVVQTPSFIRFVKRVSEYGVGYELPCCTTLKMKLVSDSRAEVDEYVERVKKSWAKTGCTLVFDTWSDMKQHTFINAVAYSPGGGVFLNSFEVSEDRNTGVCLKDLLLSAIEDIGSEHVVQFISDNTSYFESVGDMLIEKYPHMYKTQCPAHGIQLLLKDLYEVPWIQRLIDDSKLVVTYMYKHSDVLSMMRVHTNGRELKQPCKTRFASYFFMLQSILNAENGLRQLVESSEWQRSDHSKKEMAKRVAAIIQNSEFWNQVQEVLQVMEPLVRVLRLVGGHGSTTGYLYEAMERAKEAIGQCCSANESKYLKILELFEVRRGNIIHPIHAATAFLNPTYMCSENFVEDQEMKEGVNFILENLISVDEKEDFIHQVQKYRMKVASLFTCTAKTMMKTSHPRIWWDYCGDSLPMLKKYAVRIFSQPCSSFGFEDAQTKKMNRLRHNMLDNLLYIRMNTLMMEKFNKREAEELEAINLDRLNELIEYDPDQDDLENLPLKLLDKSTPDDLMNEADLSWNCAKETHSSELRSLNLKLQFLNNLSLPIFTGARIEGEEHSTLQVALVDCFTGQIVKCGPESSAKVEIVVLKVGFGDDEGDNWTVEEFNNNIVREREGKKPLLTGDTVLNLKVGVGYVGEISFTDHSGWTRSHKLRLGARIVDISAGTRVLEAKTESFIVRDHCGELLYEKHHPPSLSDEVWRLEEIGKDGAFHKRLSQENINTVKDFLILLYRDPPRLRYILGTGTSAEMWEGMVEHARTCVLEKTIYCYCPSNLQQKTGVVFNVVGQLMGRLSEGQYVLVDKLSKIEKDDAHNMLISAFEHWEEVESFDDEASLICSSAHFTNVPASSSSSCSSWTKYLASQKIGGFNYAPSTASSPDIISPIYCTGETSGSGNCALHTRESMDLLIDQTLNFPGQVTNMLISNSEHITQALCSEDHLQILNTNLESQNMSLESPANLQSAVDGFLFTRSSSRTLSIGNAQRRWTKLVTVLKWFLQVKGLTRGKYILLVH